MKSVVKWIRTRLSQVQHDLRFLITNLPMLLRISVHFSFLLLVSLKLLVVALYEESLLAIPVYKDGSNC